ncbi:branched-chain amino acid ABC transporter permease [Paenibacillus turpanensis]|uniref:branched-chain amino acid ABC transporter permease n=1 Tax=Paenibacillus turpanensis TaxID=2689078 RepID=UPI00140D283C|nr:branched-chain amino acid ABC transporter permease [Paenibacillus turpanensis]
MIDQMLQTVPQVLIDGLTLGAVYAIVALGYTMVYGILELINFAHGDIFMTGAFVGTAVIMGTMSISAGALPAWVLLPAALITASLIAGATGVAIERVAYRPLRHSPRLIAFITAIGVSFLLQDIVRFITELTRGNYIVTTPTLYDAQLSLPVSAVFSVFNDAHFKTMTLLLLVCAVIVMIALDFFVNRTKWGTAMRAVAQDRETASLMAINVNKVIALTFFIGSALGGFGGVLFAQQYGTIDPYIGFILGLKAFTAAVLGGIGNMRGAMFGGILLGVIEMFSAANLGILTAGAFGAEYKDVFAFSLLIIVLIFKPEGFFGRPIKEKV